ncbi:ABC transporter ATP-binding protein [Sediminivirga luteola]|uniref:ABC transporter ATP-binding protein n=1 Tax=Sediminivirga luteola TaxID=1774748 RepID=UPI001F58FB75|nr:ABC transporter ATP-binding protein [Sediminivirga luteola]MCI2266793.1 ABC transporter ATP-binding protein/permease [Sediminivirga luteola]
MNTLTPVVALLRRIRRGRDFAVSVACIVALQLTLAASLALSSLAVTSTVLAAGGGVVAALLLAAGAAMLAHGLFVWLESWFSHAFAYRVLGGLRKDVHRAIERAAPMGLGRRRTGDVVARAMGDVETLEWFFAHTLGAALAALITPSVLIGVLTALTGPQALLLLLPAVLLVLVPAVFQRRQRQAGTELRERTGALAVTALDGIQSIAELLSRGRTDALQQQLKDGTAGIQRVKARIAWLRGGEGALVEVILAATSLLVLLALAFQAGEIPLLLLPTLSGLAMAALNPVMGLAGILARIGEISAASGRVLEILDLPDPLDHALETAPPPSAGRADSAPALEFADVRFSFPGGPAVLDGVSFQVPRGQTLAIVGESGAGKSTLGSLMLRFADPDDGVVRVDGHDARALEPDELRRLVALIPQDSFVFASSVRTNLRLADPAAGDEALWSALRRAALAERIGVLPDGLDGLPGDRGEGLSGGERQRLGLARAFLRDPEILVLDESLASLDPELEERILTELRLARADRTTVLIAHRLRSIEAADAVLFLAAGRVRAQGTHEELLHREDYRGLLASQLPDPPPAPGGRAADEKGGATHGEPGH